MATLSPIFKKLVARYALADIEFPHLKPITLAQWMLESGRGKSELAKEFLNFGGLKWRSEMSPHASKIYYEAHDGGADYCTFESLDKYIHGYWRFIGRSPYDGWREHTSSGEDFIDFVGPIYCPSDDYVDKVKDLLKEATKLLDAEASPANIVVVPDGTGNIHLKPHVKEFIQSPYSFSRNGSPIRKIVLHYTTASTASSTINHFLNNSKTVSAHYIVDKNGDIYQMVHDSHRAHHCAGSNSDSIGIEHVAVAGDQLTVAQEEASAALIRWLVAEYEISLNRITGHNFTPGYTGSTSCPNVLFGAFTPEAIQTWLQENVA